MARIARL